MTPRDSQVILVKSHHSPRDGADRSLRVTILKQKLLQGRARSLLQHQRAQLAQIGNGPDHRIWAVLGG